MQEPSKSALKLKEMIKKAIDDGKITPDEREQIMILADEDGVIDPEERKLLQQLQDMIESGAIKLAAE